MRRADEIREAFLRYFEAQGHTRVPSASLVPAGDPTLLFTNAGMVQFKDVFLGLEQRSYRRAVTVQKCMRVSGKHNDLENVGPSPGHHTFFEMLGNFSFGDYFKRDAVRFAWELTTETLGIPPDRLVQTVLAGDDEAVAAWAAVGIPPDRIVRMREATNFWMMGDIGPCGPTSELHFDWGEAACTCGRPDCGVALDNGCARWLEIWNLVFMQFDQAADGTRTPLPRPGVDTGMGLERIVSVIQGVPSNYETDLFLPLLDHIQALLKHTPAQRAQHAVAYRVLADHGRAMTFLVADGVVPDNEGRGYVLRMIMRRAILFARRAGARAPVLASVADAVVSRMRGAYPDLASHQPFIREVVGAEEERFHQTLDAGLGRLDDLIAETRRRGEAVLPGADVFRLYDTYGFPRDLTRDVAREHGLEIDEAGFESEKTRQQERSREAGAFQSDARHRGAYAALRGAGVSSEFVGYETFEASGRVVALLRAGEQVETAAAGDDVEVVCDQTPFYAEAGGQVGDTGEIRTPGGVVAVTDTQRPVPGLVVHRGRVTGKVRVGEPARLVVDASRRWDIMRNHTATHLLHRALREILGEHARQAGSRVAPDRLRFDFLHLRPVSPDERARLEARVNEQVLAVLPVRTEVMAYKDALASGAVALFDEKYGDSVRVVAIDGYSRELCGGTHVRSTAEIGLFMIVSESSVGSGIRRIEALTGRAAVGRAQAIDAALREAAGVLRVSAEEVPDRLRQLAGRTRALEAEVVSARVREAAPDLDAAVRAAPEVGGVRVVGIVTSGSDQAALRALGDRIKPRLGSGVIVAASSTNGRIEVVVMATAGAVARGAEAGKVVAALNRRLGTRGGGRPELAQAGGGDPALLDAVMADLPQLVREALGAP
ncbi:MAG: alanine--tRNA ligase [Bacillati bacterium ANGP1]|uniref:Alanine--tRNA ligase n=1 Tax=Candidatus Segetimicrobium genomatis TaxID=2569760 RepID=A0A537M2G9_9BACT|nr:MAG: alanine--tRNA ligase [Terrabacteria group bacterium ANGP1]